MSSSCTKLSTRQYGVMSSFGGIWLRVLGGAVEAARKTLRDLDDTEVPAPLARVAASQGGRLPPPLAGRLLAELDGNEWLRAKVADDFDGDESGPSWLFLNRPDGWWLQLVDSAIAAEEDQQQRKLEAAEAKLETLEERRALAARRAKEHKKVAADSQARAKRIEASVKGDVAARLAVETAESDSLRAQLSATEARLRSLRLEHQELQAAFDGLRSRLAKARRSRGSAGTGDGTTSFVPGDPIKLARMLDLQNAAFGRDLAIPAEAAEPVADPLVLAAGVRPDASDAIRWLIGLEEAAVVLVDGYNAQFHIDRSDFTSGSARRHLVEVLQRLRGAAPIGHRVVIVYDSTLPGSRDARSSLGGVEVRFAADDRIADEEIVEMSAGLARVVVISSDREVREGAEANGAVVLWSEALAAWVGRA